ncbi:MAG: serine/threonine-protein kinase [Ferruginibacter sp.]
MGSVYNHVTEVAGYRLGERIGSGGMGEVYKAYNADLNRFAAVKILYQATFAERFKNEAYIQSSITHPNIARLYEFTNCGEKHCIVMEYVEGETLDTLLHRKRKLSNEETEDILRQIVSALVYLHKKDIQHRDIKPQNFKIQPDGTVKMLDFGIAKHKYSPKFTQIGSIVGTSEYLSPEQFQQLPGLKSDLWALGVMTYELVTGYLPFEDINPVSLQSKIRRGSFTDPELLTPGLSEKLCGIIDKCLKVNPANRISAEGIAIVLGKKDTTTGVNRIPSFPLLQKKLLVPAIAAISVLLILFFLINHKDDVKTDDLQNINELKNDTSAREQKEEKKRAELVAAGNKIIINAPGIANAELILTDGSHQPLPYTVRGKEGDKFQFTIRADGYKDKDVQVVLTPRRISYEFNLDKNNQ